MDIINNTVDFAMGEMTKDGFSIGDKEIIGDKEWYKYFDKMSQKLASMYPDFETHKVHLLVSHIIDNLGYGDKVKLLEYIYSLETINQNSIEWNIRDYFETNNSFTKGSSQYVFLYEGDSILKIFKIIPNGIELLSDYEINTKLSKTDEFNQLKLTSSVNKSFIMGFYSFEKSNSNYVFKLKEMKSTKDRDTGARCGASFKNVIMRQLNEIMDDVIFTEENVKLIKDDKGNVIQDKVTRPELCIFAELVLRYFEKIKKNEERWFLTIDSASLSNIRDLHMNSSNILVDKLKEKNAAKEPKKRGRKPKV